MPAKPRKKILIEYVIDSSGGGSSDSGGGASGDAGGGSGGDTPAPTPAPVEVVKYGGVVDMDFGGNASCHDCVQGTDWGDGVGTGEARCKKPAAGPWTVTVE